LAVKLTNKYKMTRNSFNKCLILTKSESIIALLALVSRQPIDWLVSMTLLTIGEKVYGQVHPHVIDISLYKSKTYIVQNN